MPDLDPVDVDGVAAVAVGTVVWAVLLVAAVLLHARLQAAGRGWWVWVALAGFLLGLVGLVLVLRRRAAYRTSSGASPG